MGLKSVGVGVLILIATFAPYMGLKRILTDNLKLF